MLKFIGKGSCFNTKEDNTSAYYIENNHLFLIDCGETIFHTIINKKILNDINEVSIIITHLHSDHVGSLPSLIFYLINILNIRPTIIFPKKHLIRKYFKIGGVSKKKYIFTKPKHYKRYEILPIKQHHSKTMMSYAYLINFNKEIVYYSGDGNDINKIILNQLLSNKIDYFYQEVSLYENDIHMHYSKLIELIPEKYRKKVYCMHYDNEEIKKIIKKYGFNS